MSDAFMHMCQRFPNQFVNVVSGYAKEWIEFKGFAIIRKERERESIGVFCFHMQYSGNRKTNLSWLNFGFKIPQKLIPLRGSLKFDPVLLPVPAK